MSRRVNHPQPAGIGLRACKGGAVAVCLAVVDDEPRVLASTLLSCCAEGDRLSLEPYKVAAGMPLGAPGKPSAEAVAAVEEGRRRQDQLAASGLHDFLLQLARAGHKPTVAALLVNRAGWITDLIEYSLAWPEHVPVAELLAVRNAFRHASTESGLELVELDEKSLPDLAAKTLDLPAEQIAARTKTLGADVGKPWRKEQKLACLAAWIAVRGGAEAGSII